MFGDRQFSEKSNKRAVSKEDFEQEQGAPATAWGETPQPHTLISDLFSLRS